MNPRTRRPRSALLTCGAAIAAAASMVVGGAASASADALPRACSSGHQIGATSYITFHGETAASVKQYYGLCRRGPRNWAYVWVWDSFRARYGKGRIQALALIEDDTAADGRAHAGLVGYRRGQELISRPVATTHDCTRAVGYVRVFLPHRHDPEYAGTFTGQRC